MDQQQKKETVGATVFPIGLAQNKEEERYVRGDLAAMVHLIEQAYSTASTAHAIARRRRASFPVLGDRINSLQVEALDQIIESMEKAEAATERALRDVVAGSPLLSRSYRPHP